MARPENFETRCLDRLKMTAEIYWQWQHTMQLMFSILTSFIPANKKLAKGGNLK